MLLLVDYRARMSKNGRRDREKTALLGRDTDFSLVRDTSPCARLNRVVAARCSRSFGRESRHRLTKFVATARRKVL